MKIPDGEMFFIYSIKHTEGQCVITWWRPDDCGYTYDLDDAGIYSRDQVLQNLAHYHNGIDTCAVPVELARSQSRAVVYNDHPANTVFGIDQVKRSTDERICRLKSRKRHVCCRCGVVIGNGSYYYRSQRDTRIMYCEACCG